MVRTERPCQFDRSAALGAAMELFWRHGYESTSLDQLRRAMGGLSSASSTRSGCCAPSRTR